MSVKRRFSSAVILLGMVVCLLVAVAATPTPAIQEDGAIHMEGVRVRATGAHVVMPLQEDEAEEDDFSGLLTEWSGLLGLGALVALLVNTLKKAGVVADGQAQTWSAGLNLLGLAILLALKVFAPDVDIAGIDAQAASFVDTMAVVVGYVFQLSGSKAAHSLLRGVPLIGYSFDK